MKAKPIERVCRDLIARDADVAETQAALRLLVPGTTPGTALGPLAQCLLADRLVQLDPWVVCDDLPPPQALRILDAGLDLLEGDARATVVRRVLHKFAGFIRIADGAGRFGAEVAWLRAVAREELTFHRGRHGPFEVIARVLATLREERRHERALRQTRRQDFARHAARDALFN